MGVNDLIFREDYCMDIITMEKLTTLLAVRSDWCISLFMPTYRAGQKTEQNPIRFKNLLGEAEKQLLAKSLGKAKVDAILKKARNLFEASAFWQHQSDGLALFIADDVLHLFRLPIAFAEKVVVTTRFHIKPLLPLLNSDGSFHVLAISHKQVRLFAGNQYAADEIDLGDTPAALSDTLPSEWPKQNLQYQTGTPSAGGTQAAMYHGHDSGNEIKDRLQKWFRLIDKEVAELLSHTHSPLVLAGVDNLFPLYKEINTYPNLVEEGISGNPDRMTAKDFHPLAWAIVKPMFHKDREAGLAKYRQLADTELTTKDVAEAVLAAKHGRVETLFVALGVQVWGSLNQEDEKVTLSDTKQPGYEDLLDLAAIHTLVNGGSVFAVSAEDVPSQNHIAAVLRY